LIVEDYFYFELEHINFVLTNQLLNIRFVHQNSCRIHYWNQILIVLQNDFVVEDFSTKKNFKSMENLFVLIYIYTVYNSWLFMFNSNINLFSTFMKSKCSYCICLINCPDNILGEIFIIIIISIEIICMNFNCCTLCTWINSIKKKIWIIGISTCYICIGKIIFNAIYTLTSSWFDITTMFSWKCMIIIITSTILWIDIMRSWKTYSIFGTLITW
jgi:hypothetical protein